MVGCVGRGEGTSVISLVLPYSKPSSADVSTPVGPGWGLVFIASVWRDP
jgi:hypothetical protein